MKKRIQIMCLIIVVLLGLIAAIYGYQSYQKEKELNELLELGKQYLEEENYEEAIATYEKVIKIEPKDEEALENIVVVAEKWSDELVKQKEYEQALAVIERVGKLVNDERLERRRKYILEEQERHIHALQELEKLAEVCATEDYEIILNYINDNNRAREIMFEDSLLEFNKKYETSNGKLEKYKIGDGIYFYYGEFEGEQRSGEGMWLGANGDTCSFGEWKNDKPNGIQEVYCHDRKAKGNVINGLWDGNVIDECWGYQWVIKYQMGIREVLEWTVQQGKRYGIIAKRSENAVRISSMGSLSVEYGIPGFANLYATEEMMVETIPSPSIDWIPATSDLMEVLF